MRIAVFLFASFFSVSLLGQTAVDSAAIKQVDSLIRVSRAFTRKRDFDNALEINAAAQKIALEKLGRESAAYGNCCHERSRVFAFKQDYVEAETLCLEAIRIREKVLGNEHPDYATSVDFLASTYLRMGKYEDAEPLYLKAKTIRANVLGKEHPDFVLSLLSLTAFYSTIGNFEKAELPALEAIAIQKKLLGKEDLILAKSQIYLATVYSNMGYYEKSEPLFLEAIAIQEKKLGKTHSDYAVSLYGLAVLYGNMGNYEKAELYFLEALAIREKLFGKEHTLYAEILDKLTILNIHIGNYQKAELIALEAKSIYEKTLGKEHPDYARTLGNLALLYSDMGNYEKSEPIILEAIAILEKSLGKEHPDYARSLFSLAIMYIYTGKYGKAEPIVLEVRDILEKSLGKEHPDYSSSLNTLADLYTNAGNYDKAERLLLEAQADLKKSLGKEHLEFAKNLKYLADIYERQSKVRKSDSLLETYFSVAKTNLAKSTSFLSERELAIFASTFQVNGNSFSSHLLFRNSQNEEKGILPALIYDHALFQKGFLLDAANRLNNLAKSSSEAEQINHRLKDCRRSLSAEYAKPIAARNNLAELEEKANSAEKELARMVAGYAEANRQVNWQEVQSTLKPREVAIEFIHFRLNFPKETDSTMYAALILLPGAEQPIFIPLFEEKQLEALLKNSGARRSDYVNRIYTAQKTGGKSLYELVWQPIEKTLAGVKTVYFSPSGLLHRIHLAAIPTSETANLGDRFRFVELGSTRQLVVPSSAAASAGSGEALLWGGIQYDMDSTAIGAANANLKNDLARTRGDLGFEKTDSTSRLACQSTDGSRGGSWEYLPWTEKEIKAIAPILTAAGVKPTIQKGFAATEEAFKTIGSNGSGVKKPSPRILHIATHGYFFPDPKTADGGRKAAEGSEPVFKMSDHPMIRSGLLLAGSNQAWKTGKPLRPDLEDGVLTAYEISQMDLSNTELVVLSACETGLGDIQGNEGVYGLQRAFKIAGAKYLIMSLWQVPDFQTQELMTIFYQKWLGGKMPLPEAFRAAQQAMREKYEHPYFWAGFVLVE